MIPKDVQLILKTVLIMTSNVGANLIDHSTTIGFQIDRDEEQGNYERMKDRVLDELKRTFRPEFLNRLMR